MTTSPSTDNLTIYAGILYFSLDEGVTWRDLGEASQFDIVVDDDETLQYFSKRSGVRTLVKEVVTKKAARVEFTLNEITGVNLALGLGGTLITNTDGTKTFGLKENNVISGMLRITGASEVGNIVSWEGTVDIRPRGTMSLLAEEWAEIAMTGSITADENGAFGIFDVDDGEASD